MKSGFTACQKSDKSYFHNDSLGTKNGKAKPMNEKRPEIQNYDSDKLMLHWSKNQVKFNIINLHEMSR